VPALCLLAGLALLGCNPTSGHPRTSATPTPTVVSTPTLTPTPTPAVTDCQATAMTAFLGQSDSAAGHIVYAIVLIDTGTASCALDGYPTVTLVGISGDLPTTQTNGNDGIPSVSTTPAVVTIAAGGTASFVLQYRDVATGAQTCPTATQLQIVLPGGGGALVADLTGVNPCGGVVYVSPVRSGIAPP